MINSIIQDALCFSETWNITGLWNISSNNNGFGISKKGFGICIPWRNVGEI